MKWTKLALSAMTLATFGMCFTACDDPPPIELDSGSDPESEQMRAFHEGDIFELEGDIVDGPPAGEDWTNIHTGPNNAIASTGIVEDPVKGTVFSGGGSKDTLDIDSWRQQPVGSVPDKNNITNAYAAAYVDGSDLNIYFGADRFATAGDAFLGFWFFQNPVTTNPDGTFDGVHVDDDLLVLVNFEQGGAAPNIQVLVWDDDEPNNLRLLYEDQAECDSADVENACAITNDAPIEDVPWDYTPKSGPAGTIPVNAFFEGGVKLTEVFPNKPPCFASFMAETRSSTSVSATLKDFVLGEFQACNPGIKLTAACDNVTLEPVTGGVGFVVTYSGRIENTSTGPEANLTITSLTGPEGSTPTITGGVNVLVPGAKVNYTGTFHTTTFNSDDPAAVTFGGEVEVMATGLGGAVSDKKNLDPVCSLCP